LWDKTINEEGCYFLEIADLVEKYDDPEGDLFE
jgi:hypothetical protein